jgi:hypothetical protein
MKTEFVSKDYTAGQLNTMIKELIKEVGENGPNLLLQGKLKIKVIKESILNWLGTTTTSATTEKFVSMDKFVKDSKEVKFYAIWGNFTNWFLTDDGKIEEPISEQTLRYGNLTNNSIDGPIIEELCGEAKAETTLSELYDLLKKQPKGEDGDLLTNGRANIFYIKDRSVVLRAVRVDWDDGGWVVCAYSVEDPDEWNAGNRVFSRNS